MAAVMPGSLLASPSRFISELTALRCVISCPAGHRVMCVELRMHMWTEGASFHVQTLNHDYCESRRELWSPAECNALLTVV